MKKIAVGTVKAFLQENKTEDRFVKTFTIGESSFDVIFHTALTVTEKTSFINRVLSGCFDIKGDFRPEYVSPMFRATIIQMCTNLPVLSLKNEKDENGGSLMDLEAMNDLYMAMDLDNLNNPSYRAMMGEMVYLSGQAIDWKRDRALAEHDTDAAIRSLLDAMAKKVENMDTVELMQYASQLSEATKGLGEGDILKGLLQVEASKEK